MNYSEADNFEVSGLVFSLCGGINGGGVKVEASVEGLHLLLRSQDHLLVFDPAAGVDITLFRKGVPLNAPTT